MPRKTTPESRLPKDEQELLDKLRHDRPCHLAYDEYSKSRNALKKAQDGCNKCLIRAKLLGNLATK